jgi:hypothetical protein
MALEVLATIGILVATPQQCLTCHEFSNELDHITFDVERLTMLTMGMSQFNAQRALQLCFEKEIIKENPFVAIDAGCVGRLMKECIMKCRRMRAGGSVTLKIGVDCGAHYVCARYHQQDLHTVLNDTLLMLYTYVVGLSTTSISSRLITLAVILSKFQWRALFLLRRISMKVP